MYIALKSTNESRVHCTMELHGHIVTGQTPFPFLNQQCQGTVVFLTHNHFMAIILSTLACTPS